MEIRRYPNVSVASGAPILEVREIDFSRYDVVLIENGTPSHFGSYSNNDVAEANGVHFAHRRGHRLLHIVHSEVADALIPLVNPLV